MRQPLLALVAAASLVGCAGSLDNPLAVVASGTSVVAERAVVTVDSNAHRVAVLVPTVEGTLARSYVSLKSPLVSLVTSSDGARTFVLTAGVAKTRTTPAVAPELIVFAVDGVAVTDVHYTLPSGVGELTLDPAGAYAAVTPARSGNSALVVNPNALAIVDLHRTPSATNPLVRSLERNASLAASLSFSPELLTPKGARRFLVGIGPREAALIDLAAAFGSVAAADTKIPLTSSGATSSLVPSAVRFDDGEALLNDDARIAFSLSGEGSILTATLLGNDAPLAGESDLRAVVNLTDVGAPVSDFAFLPTPEGRRIAALTPSRQRAVLADPATSLTTRVPLARAYNGLRVLPGATSSTVMLTASGGSTGAVALWDIPMTSDQPYRAVEAVVNVRSLDEVKSVPGSATTFVVVSAGGSEIVVLDTSTRTSTPVVTSTSTAVSLSRDGLRAYIVPRDGESSFASLSLKNLTSSSFSAGAPSGIFGEIRRADGSPVVVFVQGSASTSLSMFDPLHPEDLGKRWDDLLVEGVR